MSIITINELVQKIINISESIDNFYEIEVSVLIRKDGGAKSDFIRAQSHWTPKESDPLEDSDSITEPFKWM